jgi:N-sulfoglucosamine sulfohydrolase
MYMKMLKILSLISAMVACSIAQPNILFITVDDMNADSLGVFGCPVEDTTPNLDKLAGEGIRFEHAHVQAPNCTPSRNVFQTGRYPHNSGVEGFYDIEPDYPILPDLLKAEGYRVGIWGKVADTTPRSNYMWNKVLKTSGKGSAKNAEVVSNVALKFMEECKREGKPFYLVMNLSDPHHPLFGSTASKKSHYDIYPPSRIYTEEEVIVPGFLPDIPGVRAEVTRYYNSVRRADDIIGAILQALEKSGEAENTIVMFLSDHGMPFPFAKTNLYRYSTRTPWLVRFPGVVKPGRVDSTHMITAIDFFPTILELCQIALPEELDGRSIASLLRGDVQSNRNWVIKEFHENAAGVRNPMRAIETKQYGYIFNPWADGERLFKSATLHSQSYRAMQKAAASDARMAARVNYFNHRELEEFYDYRSDPFALDNKINDPNYLPMINQLRRALAKEMKASEDPALAVFLKRNSADKRDEFMKQQEEYADVMNHSGLGRKRKL